METYSRNSKWYQKFSNDMMTLPNVDTGIDEQRHNSVFHSSGDLLGDQFQALMKQEISPSYCCVDYLSMIRALAQREHDEIHLKSCGTPYPRRPSPTSVQEDADTAVMILAHDHVHIHVHDHDDQQFPSSAASPVLHFDETWREKIAEWLYKVVDHFNLDREIVSVTLDLLDRHLSNCVSAHHADLISENGVCSYCTSSASTPLPCPKNPNRERYFNIISRDGYRLAAMGAFLLALKLVRPIVDNVPDFFSLVLVLGNGNRHIHVPPTCTGSTPIRSEYAQGQAQSRSCLFTNEDLEKIESCILTNLSWRVSPPTPLTFLDLLFEVLYRSAVHVPHTTKQAEGGSRTAVAATATHHLHYNLAKILETAKFSVELSACDYFFVHRKPSSIALASMLNSLYEHSSNNNDNNNNNNSDVRIPSPQIFLSHVHNASGKTYCHEVHLCQARLRRLQVTMQ